jgi:hypothetical protein
LSFARLLEKSVCQGQLRLVPKKQLHPNNSDTHAKVFYHEEDFEAAFVEYDEVMRKNAHLYQSEHIQYEKRIRLELTNDQRETLRENGVIPNLATVHSVFGSLDIFGYNETVEEITWVELISRLTEDDAQRLWPGSALAWTNLLGRILRKALRRQLTLANPEGLPLYYWQPNSNGGGISYRPSITKQVRAGGLTSFTISFTQLPPELTARPSGSLWIKRTENIIIVTDGSVFGDGSPARIFQALPLAAGSFVGGHAVVRGWPVKPRFGRSLSLPSSFV